MLVLQILDVDGQGSSDNFDPYMRVDEVLVGDLLRCGAGA
jgi:hypothetical protein